MHSTSADVQYALAALAHRAGFGSLAKGPRHSATMAMPSYFFGTNPKWVQGEAILTRCLCSPAPVGTPRLRLARLTPRCTRAADRGHAHEGGGHRRWALRRRASRWARWARFSRRRRASRPLRRRPSRRSWARRPPHRPCHACSRRASPHLASSSRCVARARRAARAASERTGRATPFASAFRLRRAGSRA